MYYITLDPAQLKRKPNFHRVLSVLLIPPTLCQTPPALHVERVTTVRSPPPVALGRVENFCIDNRNSITFYLDLLHPS